MMKMFRILSVILITLLVSGLAARAEPALLRISDEDTVIWVFGTFHILPPEAKWRTTEVSDALEEADAIYMEADVWSGGPQEMGLLIQTYGLLPAGYSLASLMREDEWASVANMAIGIGIPPEVLLPLRPWFAAITLGVQSAMVQGFDPNSGVDVQLFNEASAEGRDIRFFETAEQQIRFFADLPPEIETAMLVETAAEAASAPEQFDILLAAWLAGDLDRIEDIGNAPLAEAAPEAFEALILARNRQWVLELTDLMEGSGTYFVAVGSAHLPGEEGVAALMAEQGFVVGGY